MAKDRVLVTGGAGFIGSHLCKKLDEQGKYVVALDNLSHSNLIGLTGIKVQLIEGDIRDKVKLKQAMKGCEVVYHLAALSDAQQCDTDPATAITVNVDGMRDVLHEAVKVGARVVVASSAAVYPDSEELGKEDYPYDAAKTLYGRTKRYAEHLCSYLEPELTWRTVCLRLFNVWGDRCHGVVPAIQKSIETGKPFNMTGKGQQIRDFVHVDNVVWAFYVAGANPGLSGRFNIGTGVGTSIMELYNHMVTENRNVVFDDGDPGVMHSVADNSKAIAAGLLPKIRRITDESITDKSQ